MPKIALVTYSMYGHVAQLAAKVEEGLKSQPDTTVTHLQFAETLPTEVLTKMHAAPKRDLPEIKASDLTEYDAFVFGFPTRYGRAPAQVSALFDATGQLWAKGALVGKMITMFTSTASQHGGLESTYLTTMPFFAHHGLIYVPIGFANPELSSLDAIVGGSAYGAGTVAAGDGSRQPTKEDLAVSEAQGKFFAKTVAAYVKGQALLASTSVLAAKAIPESAITAPVSDEVPAVEQDKGYEIPATSADQQPVNATKESTTSQPTTEKTAAAPSKQKKAGLFGCCSKGAAKNYD